LSLRAPWRGLRPLFPYLRRVKWLLALSVAVLFVVSALTAAKAWIIQPATDAFLSSKPTRGQLYTLCAAVAGLFVFQAVLTWVYQIVSRVAGSRVVMWAREDLFAHLLRQDLGYFASRPSSDLTSRVVNDVLAFQFAAIGGLQTILHEGITLLLLLGVMFWMEWKLALFCLVLVGVLGIVLRLAMRRLSSASRRVQEMLARITNQLTEMIGGIEVLVSFGMGRRWLERFHDVSRESYETSLRSQRTVASASATIGIVVGCGLAAILLLTGRALLDAEVTPGRFLSLLAAMYLIQKPLLGLGNAFASLTTGLAAGARAMELLEHRPSIRDPEGAAALARVEGRIEFRHVTFAYGAEPALRDLSFAIEPHELVVMVGDSGSGKSTAARMLMRFYDPGSGEVLLDGRSVRDLARGDLYRAVSYVSQDVFLFDGTVAFNLRVGKPDASDAEVAEAVRAACLEDCIAQLPKGLDTVVGERGVRLSGGQRQRISIARALLTGAPVVVLDEATSALDMDLERRVLSNLVQGPCPRTIFAISHRLSLAAVADRVMVLKDGRLVEVGTAAELASAGGEYTRLQRAAGAELDRERSRS
jgi:subfamily B ATP-binding cassette protein MsbA